MRRALLMAIAAAAFLGVTSPAAMASGKKPNCSDKNMPGCSEKRCSNPGKGNSKHGCEPKPCKSGYERTKSGKCKPKAPKCTAGEEKVRGKCVPKCNDNQYRDKDGKCQGKPPVCQHKPCVPPPKHGPCSKADLVALEDLFAGTGALVCLYLGDNASNASDKRGGDCPKATLALPIDKLLGACLYLPPADVGGGGGGGGTPHLPELPKLPLPGGDTSAGSAAGTAGLLSSVRGMLG